MCAYPKFFPESWYFGMFIFLYKLSLTIFPHNLQKIFLIPLLNRSKEVPLHIQIFLDFLPLDINKTQRINKTILSLNLNIYLLL